MLLRKAKKTILVALMLLLTILTGACGKKEGTTKVVLTTGFGKDEVFKIEDSTCTAPEIMVYLATLQNQYKAVYGEEVFSVSLNGVSVEENLKETVLARISQIKVLNLMARKRQIVLDDYEQKLVNEAAEKYYLSLSKEEIEKLGVTRELIVQMYGEYVLAEKLYAYLIQDINPEISDDEARIVTVSDIYFRTYTHDGSGEKIEYSDSSKAHVYERARDAYRLVTEDAASFDEMLVSYSDSSETTISFGKGEKSAALEEAAFRLEKGEISAIVEDEDGYHILKCINTFDREETDRNKVLIMEKKKKQVFGEEYDTFLAGLTYKLNDKLWAEIPSTHDEAITTSEFFNIIENNY